MRELEFRGWSEERKMYFIGNALSLEYYTSDGENFTLNAPSFKNNGDYDELILEQYTGLRDKNGVKIFEGDIVRILYTDWISQTGDKMSLGDYKISISKFGHVIYQQNEYVLEMINHKFNDWYYGSLIEGKHGEKEVIGNIHENAELLK